MTLYVIKNVIIIIFVLVVGIILSIFFYDPQLLQSIRKSSTISSLKAFQTPTPTPYAFQEVTIPALRSREYQSKLNEQTPYSENSTYDSYLTSYSSDGGHNISGVNFVAAMENTVAFFEKYLKK